MPLSSATYLVNDVRDREEDRLHPRKRTRPVAAGELSPRARCCSRRRWRSWASRPPAALRPGLGAVALGYLALTVSYTLWLRCVAVADIAAVAAGFVLRALAGGARPKSPLALVRLVTASGRLFLVAAKRYAELSASTAGGVPGACDTCRRYSAGICA